MTLTGRSARWLAVTAAAAIIGYLIGSAGEETAVREPLKPPAARQRSVTPPASPPLLTPPPVPTPAPDVATRPVNPWSNAPSGGFPDTASRRPHSPGYQFRPLEDQRTSPQRYAPPGADETVARQWKDRYPGVSTMAQPQSRGRLQPYSSGHRFRPIERPQRRQPPQDAYRPVAPGYAPPYPYDPRFPPTG
jgi:hypothetical protein